jgi:hypothetical protein
MDSGTVTRNELVEVPTGRTGLLNWRGECPAWRP